MANRSLVLKMKMPKDIGGDTTVMLYTTDFKLTWQDYLKKHMSKQFSKFENQIGRYELTDNRRPELRRRWNFDQQVREFINSFQRVQKKYHATLSLKDSEPFRGPRRGRRRAGAAAHVPMPVASAPVNVSPSKSVNNSHPRTAGIKIDSIDEAGPSGTNGLKRKYPEEFMFNKQSTSNGDGPRSRLRHNVNRYQDDAASMAPSIDSQDSQEDLIAAGLQDNDYKDKVIRHIVGKIDNSTLLRMQLELTELKMKDKWYKVMVKYIPKTAYVLEKMLMIPEPTQ